MKINSGKVLSSENTLWSSVRKRKQFIAYYKLITSLGFLSVKQNLSLFGRVGLTAISKKSINDLSLPKETNGKLLNTRLINGVLTWALWISRWLGSDDYCLHIELCLHVRVYFLDFFRTLPNSSFTLVIFCNNIHWIIIVGLLYFIKKTQPSAYKII